MPENYLLSQKGGDDIQKVFTAFKEKLNNFVSRTFLGKKNIFDKVNLYFLFLTWQIFKNYRRVLLLKLCIPFNNLKNDTFDLT